MEIVDVDGHVSDIADQEAIAKYMPADNRSSQIFPVLDHQIYLSLRQSFVAAGQVKMVSFPGLILARAITLSCCGILV